MNRLYPYIAEVWNQYPDQLDMKNYNFFYLADDEHNKERDVCWTDLYVDPAGQDWMFSCIAPVYVSDSLKAVVGLDVKFSAIAERIERLKLPWKASVVLVTGDSRDPRSSKEAANRIEGGTIIDATQGAWGLLRLEPPSAKYDYKQEGPITKDTRLGCNIFEIKDKSLSESLKMKFAKPDGDLTKVSTNGEELLVANASIPSTGWQLFVLVEESAIFEPTRKLRELTRLIGWAAVGLMGLFYAFFFVWLWNRSNKMATSISGPLNQLSRATSNLGKVSEEVVDIPSTGIDEIDRLSASFAKMSTSLKEQTKKLVDARVNSEMKEREAELAFTRGLYQSASANLHDAGNAVTILESSLFDLNKVVKSTEQYPEVFRRLKHGGVDSRAILKRFEQVLIDETVPLLRGLASSILRLKDAIKRSINEQQAAFRAVKRQGEFKKEFAQASQAVDLTALLHEICEIFRRYYPALETAIAPGLMVRSHRTQLWAGLDNLIRNAVHASPEQGPIHVSAVAVANGVMVSVADQGEGISAENLGKVGERGYTTRSGGHGLGLNGFREFLELFGGSLRVHSPGLRQGTTVTVEIRNA
jgi:signal transduction histidine kinase